MEKVSVRSWFSFPCLNWGKAELELDVESPHIQSHPLSQSIIFQGVAIS